MSSLSNGSQVDLVTPSGAASIECPVDDQELRYKASRNDTVRLKASVFGAWILRAMHHELFFKQNFKGKEVKILH